MKIKTYHAANMQDAIRQIKAELGPDAVILSTRQVRATSGTLALLGRHMVEVTAAIDTTPARKTTEPAAPPVSTTTSSFEAALQHKLNAAGATTAEGQAVAAELRAVWDQMRDELDRLRDVMDRMPKEQESGAVAPASTETVPPAPRAGFYRYLDLVLHGRGVAEELRTDISRQPPQHVPAVSGASNGWLERLPLPVNTLYHALTARGMAADHAKQLVSSLQEQKALDVNSDAAIRQAARKSLCQELLIGGPVLGPDDRKKTVIMVGPTGAGKTTSIAKLAAYYRLHEQRKVVLITLDTYRMAAVEQLRAYARLLQIPLEVALTKADALTFIRQHDQAELILVDTMGRSPRDQAGIEELKQLLTLDHPVETHLVLAATTRQRDLLDSFTRFSEVPIHRLLFTKLDETCSYGALATVASRTRMPLSYLGIGQEVPDDFLVARADTLADLILGGTLPPRTKKHETPWAGNAEVGTRTARTSWEAAGVRARSLEESGVRLSLSSRLAPRASRG